MTKVTTVMERVSYQDQEKMSYLFNVITTEKCGPTTPWQNTPLWRGEGQGRGI